LIGVNVLPESYVYARKRAARVQGWLITLVVVAVAFSFPIGFDVFKTARAASLEEEVKPLHSRLAATKSRLADCLAAVTDLRHRLSRADALRSKRPWKNLLATLTAKMPEEVWLTSLESLEGRAKDAGRRPSAQPAADGKQDAVELAGPTGLRLTGYALGHEYLYAFMGTLNDGVLFNRVELVKAGREPLADGTAVRFVLECSW
jgi:Tfp pilus assembly protein PilN